MILMNDFKNEYNLVGNEVNSAISRVLTSGWYILGKEVEAFEAEFAKYIGTKYCVGVGNGLEAIQISLMALNIGKGDEVITVSNTAVATVLAISNVGAVPVFVDVDESYLIDVKKIEEKVNSRTKAIIPVHLFGQVADMTALRKLAKKYQLNIIEDACQAHGAKQNEKKSGSFGELGCFSFYPTKNLGAYGDGGAIVTNSKKLYEQCKMLRNYGQKNRYEHEIMGLNSRLDEIQAAILNVKLKYLDKFIEKRNKIAQNYIKCLAGVSQVKLPVVNKSNYHAFHLFVIEAENRDGLMGYLRENNVQCLVHYPIPVHKQKCYSKFNNISLEKTEYFAEKILSLPVHPMMTIKEVRDVCRLITNFYEK